MNRFLSFFGAHLFSVVMKILNVCESSLLAAEVYNLIRYDDGNSMSFDQRDPLENPEITDPDELRRIVSVRRLAGYIESSSHVGRIRRDLIPTALRVLSSFNLSKETIVRLIDAISLTGSIEGSKIYLGLILGEDPRASDLTDVDVESLRSILSILSHEQEGSVEDLQSLAAVFAEPPPKRKSISRK